MVLLPCELLVLLQCELLVVLLPCKLLVVLLQCELLVVLLAYVAGGVTGICCWWCYCHE